MTAFSDQIDSLANKLTERYTNAGGTPPSILYHYTDARGLIGMLESKSIWATDAKFLNDPSELDYIRDVVGAAAEEASANLRTRHAQLIAEELRNIDPSHVFQGRAYVASFSAKRDLLSQWRAYGGDGLGYAIGVSTKERLEPVTDIAVAGLAYPPVPFLHKVFYEPKLPGGTLWDLVVAMLAAVDTLDASAEDESVVAYDAIVKILRRFYPVIKNPGFAEEDEWRAVFWNHAVGGYLEPLKFRPNSQGIAPYVPLRWQTERHEPPIEEIVMGPRVPATEGYGALYMMLLAHGYSAGMGDLKTQLSHSAATYRK